MESFSTLEVRANRARLTPPSRRPATGCVSVLSKFGPIVQACSADSGNDNTQVSVPSKFGPIVQVITEAVQVRICQRFSTLEVRANRASAGPAYEARQRTCFSTLEVRANRARSVRLLFVLSNWSFSTLEVRANRASHSQPRLPFLQ